MQAQVFCEVIFSANSFSLMETRIAGSTFVGGPLPGDLLYSDEDFQAALSDIACDCEQPCTKCLQPAQGFAARPL